MSLHGFVKHLQHWKPFMVSSTFAISLIWTWDYSNKHILCAWCTVFLFHLASSILILSYTAFNSNIIKCYAPTSSYCFFSVSHYSHIKQRIIEKSLLGRYGQNCFEMRRKSKLNLLGHALEPCKVHVFFDDECYILKKCIALARSLSVGQEWFSNKRDNTNKDLHPIVQSRHRNRTAFSMSE